MHPRVKPVAFLALVAAVAASATWVTEAGLRRTRAPEDAHAWVHRQLDITPAQEQAIEAVEHRFTLRKRDLMERIRLGNMELGQAMLEAKAQSPQVAAAVRSIHAAQAELQQATIDHVFEMRSELRPDQYDKLLNLTANALFGTPR